MKFILWTISLVCVFTASVSVAQVGKSGLDSLLSMSPQNLMLQEVITVSKTPEKYIRTAPQFAAFKASLAKER